MKIAQIVPGVGETSTCENCLRDAALMKAFDKRGHEVVVVPLYLPFRPEGEEPISDMPIFFGGINVYLQQKSVIFRKSPRWLDRMFDKPKLLEWALRRFQMVDAKFLGQTTVSMLKGMDGFQAKEFKRLSKWLSREENRPDAVCISNALLSSLAGPIKGAIGGPIVCLLQDEDKFLDDLREPYNQQGWEALCERVRDVDVFIAVSQRDADVMKERVKIGEDKMHVVCAESKGGINKAEIERAAEEIAEIFIKTIREF